MRPSYNTSVSLGADSFAEKQPMQVKSITYEKSWYGVYYRQRLFSMQRMDDHIAELLGQGWSVLSQTSHSGPGRGFQPFSKRDTITITFQKS